MIPLFSDKEFEEAGSNDKLKLRCTYCHNTFLKYKRYISFVLKNGPQKGCGSCEHCSSKCHNLERTSIEILTCYRCQNQFKRSTCNTLNNIKKSQSNRTFCSKSCAAIYNNAHKKTGTRRSKLEKYLENHLSIIFPNLAIRYNKTDAINAELDIYIPELNLAFELNGIFHYEPIYGQEKLAKIQNNDKRKMQACLEKKIELCIIDSSGLKYFKEDKAKVFLDIICNIIYKNYCKNRSKRI